jgi:hypothetical protein
LYEERGRLITVIDSDMLLLIAKDKNKKKRFYKALYQKRLGYVCTTTDIVERTLASLDVSEAKDFLDFLKDLHITSIGSNAFADASLFFRKYCREIHLDLVGWTTAVFVRDLKKKHEDVKLLSKNKSFDHLKGIEEQMPVERWDPNVL